MAKKLEDRLCFSNYEGHTIYLDWGSYRQPIGEIKKDLEKGVWISRPTVGPGLDHLFNRNCLIQNHSTLNQVKKMIQVDFRNSVAQYSENL